MTPLRIFEELQHSWYNESKYTVDWSKARAEYFIDDTNADKGVYTLLVYVLSVRGKHAAVGCYDYDRKEQAENIISKLNELYFN